MVTVDGQALIQSVPPGVDTSELETDLEVLADKWSQISEKVTVIIFIQFVKIRIDVFSTDVLNNKQTLEPWVYCVGLFL